ncbi:MAG: DUF421 domain-containing protein [Clostridia bacterium]
MDLIKIVFLSLGSILVLFILTKIMGNREISQLNMFDYIVGITIGSIAAEMATSLENNFWEPVVAMIVYGLVATGISYLTCKSIKFRRLVSGRGTILLDNGKLYRKNFIKAKLDINEFLMQARINGYFNIADIQTAILEGNGKISFLPVSSKRPVNPEDLNLNPPCDNVVINVILDGVVLKENLEQTGKDIKWLEKELEKQNISNLKDVFLATYDNKQNLSVYVKWQKENKHDFFE